MQVFVFMCYGVACLLFLVDGGCRLAKRVVFNSTWMTPVGLFFAFLPLAIATGSTLG